MTPEILNEWTDSATKLLKGRTIKAVRYMTPDECDGSDWSRAALVIELDNGVSLWPSMDDEGNDAGALFTTDEELPIIPVIALPRSHFQGVPAQGVSIWQK